MANSGSRQVLMAEVVDVLERNYAYISGGYCLSGSPIVTFPDSEISQAVNEDQNILVLDYLFSALQKQQPETAVVFVVDRRNSEWKSVKALVNSIFNTFGRFVENVFLLQPTGFFNKLNVFFDHSRRSFKQEHQNKVMNLNSIEDLLKYIDQNQLTADFGGTLPFKLINWISQQTAVDKLYLDAVQVQEDINQFFLELNAPFEPETVSVSSLTDINNKRVVRQQEVIDLLKSLLVRAADLISAFKQMHTPVLDRSPSHVSLPPSTMCHVICVQRLMGQMDDAEEKVNATWQDYVAKFEVVFQAKEAEEKVHAFREKVDNHHKFVSNVLPDDVIHSIDDIKSQQSNLILYDQQIKGDVTEIQELQTQCDALRLRGGMVNADFSELYQLYEECEQMIQKRLEKLDNAVKLHEAFAQAREWIDRGSQLMQLDTVSEAFLGELTSFKESHVTLDMLQELRSQHAQTLTPALEDMLVELSTRVSETLSVIDAKHSIVHHQLTSAKKHALFSSKSLPVSLSLSSSIGSSSDNGSSTSLSLSLTTRRNHLHDIRDIRPIIAFDSKEELKPPDVLDADLPVVVDCESSRQKRRHVIQELISTEKSYARDLEEVMQGYAASLDQSDHAPAELYDYRDLLFDNIDKIQRFHYSVFLKALESSRDSVSEIAQCFIIHKTKTQVWKLRQSNKLHRPEAREHALEDFYIYSSYCQNKAATEAVIERAGGVQNSFLQECQRKLNHSLPLTSYLLKPLQRITKYQLLLRELASVCVTKEEAIAMKEAVETMRVVTQYMNDSMHQLMIKGFDGDLSTLGQLLMQGELEVWSEKKRDRMQRHGFLYEKCILLCKRKKDDSSQNNDQAKYVFKNVIKMNEVCPPREVVKGGDERKFELSFTGRSGRTPEVWTMQAPTKELKAEWVRHIKRLLIRQFSSMKRKKQPLLHALPGSVEKPEPAAARLSPISATAEAETYNYSDGNNNDGDR